MTNNYRQLLAALEAKPADIMEYFEDFPSLVEGYDWSVSVSYVFTRIEAIKHTALYCGIVKLHRGNAELTWEMLNKEHMTRGHFRGLFATIFGKPLDKAILDKLSSAEKMRDKVVHGKALPDAEMRAGLRDAFDFCEAFNEFVFGAGGFGPFGQLRGFKGRGEALSKETTRWVLRAMGIPSKAPGE